jgi:hypothetical protein
VRGRTGSDCDGETGRVYTPKGVADAADCGSGSARRRGGSTKFQGNHFLLMTLLASSLAVPALAQFLPLSLNCLSREIFIIL